MLELLELFPLKYVLMVPVLNAIGYFLKHRTIIPNEFIPFLLFAVASASSIAIRWVMSGESGWLFWFDAVFLYGIVNSLKLTISAIGSYEAVRAFGFTGRRMEVQIMKRPFIRLLLAFVTASVLFGIIALIFGASFFDVFCKITDGWIFGIIFMSAFDLYSKLTKHPEKITPLYIVRLVSALIAVVMFCMAGMVNDIRACYIGLVLAGLFLGIATVSIAIPFAKEKKEEAMELKEFSVEDYEKRWAVLREKMTKLSAEKKEEILEKFLLFKLVEDSIYNNVDFARPLFNLTGEDGSANYVPVSRAKEFGVSDADIESAREYIKALIG